LELEQVLQQRLCCSDLSAPTSVAGGVGSVEVSSALSAGFGGSLSAYNNIGNGIGPFGLYYQ